MSGEHSFTVGALMDHLNYNLPVDETTRNRKLMVPPQVDYGMKAGAISVRLADGNWLHLHLQGERKE